MGPPGVKGGASLPFFPSAFLFCFSGSVVRLHQRLVEQGGVGVLCFAGAAVSGNYLTLTARNLIQTVALTGERGGRKRESEGGGRAPRRAGIFLCIAAEAQLNASVN